MTSLAAQTSQAQQLRIGIMDQRGDGRPDFAYQARILYADSVSPSTVPAKGAPITITGMGFRAGNTVTIDGAPASVTSWTSNTITAVAPSLYRSSSGAVDITVRDLATGGSTTMTGALRYQASQPQLTLLSMPSGAVVARTTAPLPLVVKAIAADGTSPLANIPISFTSAGQVQFEACGSTSCTLSTDVSGKASTLLTPLVPGNLTLGASSTIGTVATEINAIPRVQTVTALNPQLYLAQKAVVTWSPQVALADNAAAAVGIPVQWTPIAGPLSLHASLSLTDNRSIAQTTATAGPFLNNDNHPATATACAWNSICNTFTVNSISDAALQLSVSSGAQQSIRAAAPFSSVVLQIADTDGHPVSGAAVTIRQTLEPWSMPCPSQGRCPITPTSNASTATLISGLDGTITVTPLESPETAEITHLAAATGTGAFVSLDLQKLP
jgi:hypothetical protein